MRFLFALLCALICAPFVAPASGHSAPLLFVYRGAPAGNCAVQTPQIEGMLNTKVAGVDDFTTYNDPVTSREGLEWDVGCWKGKGYQLNLEIPLGFYSGGSTADIAAGKLDAYYQSIGATLVADGFANAYLRLGEENNLADNWPWEGQASFKAAFQHVYTVLHAVPGSNFKVEYNPSIGQDEGAQYPGDAFVDVMSYDAYGTKDVGNCAQPVTWTCQVAAYWGFNSIGTTAPKKPQSISETGVGARPNGRGACSSSAISGCDDPAFLTSMIALYTKSNALFFAYWDFDGGGYNSAVSSGERPGEAWVLVDQFGSTNLQSILHVHDKTYVAQAIPTITCTDPAGAVACHLIERQNGPGHFMVEVWAGSAHPAVKLTWTGRTVNANLYNPTTGTTAVIPIGAENSVAFSLEAGGTRVLAIAQ